MTPSQPSQPSQPLQPEHLPAEYYRWICRDITPAGVSLPRALVLAKDGGLTVMALDLEPEQVYQTMILQILEGAESLIFGLDRYAKPNQGTTLGDLVGGFHYNRRAAVKFTPFIIEYQDSPRVVRPLEYGNRFWNNALRHEMSGTLERLRSASVAAPQNPSA